MSANQQVSKLLGIKADNDNDFIRFRNGARTRAVLATRDGVRHRFRDKQPQVVVKLYKGKGNTEGSKQYQFYHQDWFHQIPALAKNHHIQQSVSGGVMDDVGPYAILQYVDGVELAIRLDQGELALEDAGIILYDILGKIWVPLWTAGLRFKDCHAGNFVVTPDGRITMIDTEQMRKDAEELLYRPNHWAQRDKHQESGLARLPRLVQRIILATEPQEGGAAILRKVKSAMGRSNLLVALRQLGKKPGADEAVVSASNEFLSTLRSERLIR